MSHRYIVVFARITEDKEKGMQFDGPFIGPIADTEAEAVLKAKDLTNDPKNGTVVPKIVELYRNDICGAMELAQPHFDKLKAQMQESEEIMQRPIKRKKRK